MAASLADVTDVLRKQIEAQAEQAVQLKAMARSLESVVELLEEIRDARGMDDDDDDEDDEELEDDAGLDGVVNGIAAQVRDRIRSGGLKGLLNRKKKPNGHAPKEARATTTDTET